MGNRITGLILITIGVVISCKNNSETHPNLMVQNPTEKELAKINKDTIKFTNGFDFPVGKPDAQHYYDAQNFGVNNHLGEDWNGKGGGNTDLGDPIYSIANGYVTFARDIGGGWGKVIKVAHYIDQEEGVESLYAHCDSIWVKEGEYTEKGQQIATIGNNDGQYYAHLHFEIRNEIGMPIGGGYSRNTEGYINPTKFIKENRGEE